MASHGNLGRSLQSLPCVVAVKGLWEPSWGFSHSVSDATTAAVLADISAHGHMQCTPCHDAICVSCQAALLPSTSTYHAAMSPGRINLDAFINAAPPRSPCTQYSILSSSPTNCARSYFSGCTYRMRHHLSKTFFRAPLAKRTATLRASDTRVLVQATLAAQGSLSCTVQGPAQCTLPAAHVPEYSETSLFFWTFFSSSFMTAFDDDSFDAPKPITKGRHAKKCTIVMARLHATPHATIAGAATAAAKALLDICENPRRWVPGGLAVLGRTMILVITGCCVCPGHESSRHRHGMLWHNRGNAHGTFEHPKNNLTTSVPAGLQQQQPAVPGCQGSLCDARRLCNAQPIPRRRYMMRRARLNRRKYLCAMYFLAPARDVHTTMYE